MKKTKYEAQDFHVMWRARGKRHRIPRQSTWFGYLVTVWADAYDFHTGECFTEAVESFQSWEKARTFIMSHGIDRETADSMRPLGSIRRRK